MSTRSLACGVFTIERVLWDPSIWHVVNMSQPVESALGVEVLDSSLGEDLGVCHAVRPLVAQDVPQMSQIEYVQPLFLSGVRSPSLAAIEEGAEDAGSVYSHLGMDDQFAVLPRLF